MDREKEDISLEDLIERERAALGSTTTKVTLETFLAWKKKKLKEREEKEKKDTDKKKSDYKSGREGGISGREMFMFNPDLAVGENMEEGDADFDFKNMKEEPEEGEEEEVEVRYMEIDLNALRDEYITMDVATDAVADRLSSKNHNLANNIDGVTNGIPNGNDPSLTNSEEGAVAIDEDLFGGDDEDLQDLEDQLEELAVTS
ncbi:Zinc finger CCCH domain-containing protein 15-like protein [Armadillidium vulgare]|nr:Zinc finger CCCH domain-containing protein 15-like protein [Armadillidium vulgare]